MSDDWEKQLRSLYETDKSIEQAKLTQQQQEQQKFEQAIELLQKVKAHELLRKTQELLLNGAGALVIYEKSVEYDRAIVLAWQGSVSNAQRPNPQSPEGYSYIAVGVRNGQLLVNNQPVPATSDALRTALLEAAKNPAVTQRQKPLSRSK